MAFEYIFVFETLTTLVIGYSYLILLEKLPEPGATITLFMFLFIAFLLVECARELGNVIDGDNTLVDAAPGLSVKWIGGGFATLFPLFYASTLGLQDLYFYSTRTSIALLAWAIPVPYILIIIRRKMRLEQGG